MQQFSKVELLLTLYNFTRIWNEYVKNPQNFGHSKNSCNDPKFEQYGFTRE